jgi:secreted Zn-dependent insulinase-like peptidase
MKLVLMAPLNIDDILEMIIASFDSCWRVDRLLKEISASSSSPSLPSMRKVLDGLGFPLEPSALGMFTRIVPIKKNHRLIVSWQLPSTIGDYKCKTTFYLSHLIGHEGPGSLLSALKQLGYATELSAGVSLYTKKYQYQ